MPRARLVLVFLVFCLALPFAARAGSDPFTVSGIKIAATASSASEAFNFAVNGGRRKAWDTLIHRLTRQQDWDRVPPVDDATLQRMINGYQLADEMRSTTQYAATATYTFNADQVRNFLQAANIAYTDSSAQPVLVVPLSPGYTPGSTWALAWAGVGDSVNGVPLILPGHDALTNSALSGLDFADTSWSDVEPTASRLNVREVALAQIEQPADGMMQGNVTVKIRILSPDSEQVLPNVVLPLATGSASEGGYGDVATAAAKAIANAWKSHQAIDFNQQATLTAEVRLTSLADWGAIQQKLATVPVVLNFSVVAMSIGEARIDITYAGTMTQLNDFLSRASLMLANRDGAWWLSSNSSSAAMESP